MPDNTFSPYIQEHLVIHFFHPSRHVPWWARLGWRPMYSHVAVEWDGLIHEIPYDGEAELYLANEYLAAKPSDMQIPLPIIEQIAGQAESAVWIQGRYKNKRVDRLKCVLWRFGFRRWKPRSCATLVSLWIVLFTKYSVDACLPDELFWQLVHHAMEETHASYSSTE